MKIITKITIFLMVIGSLYSPASLRASSVTDIVRDTTDKILAIVKDPSLKGPGKIKERRAKMRSILHKSFNFVEMGKRTLGKHWRKRNKDEKKEFIKLFAALIENKYLDKIGTYTDEEIRYTAERSIKKVTEIKTLIITQQGTEIPLDYRLLKDKKGRWRIYDIKIEGISLIKNYRSQFNKIIRKSYDKLVKELKKRTKK